MAFSQVNLEAKNHLARLLATENIWIQHRNVKTASFDTVSRILTFPIWKDMEGVLYTFLAGHEVGHCIWTERARLDKIAKRIDPKNVHIAASYVNIVEDARIERLIKSRYPGLKTIFTEAYRILFERDFFGVQQRDVQTRSFIDRINLYFKVGHHLNLTFTPDEQKLVNKVANTLTFNDVMVVTKEIYEFSKHEHEQQPAPSVEDLLEQFEKQKKQEEQDEDDESETVSAPCADDAESDEDSDGEDGDGGAGDSDEDQEGEDGGESGGSGDSGDDSSDQEDEENEAGDGGSNDQSDESDENSEQSGDNAGDADADDDADESSDDEAQKPSDGKNPAKPVDPGPPAAPTTQQNFDDAIEDFNDTRNIDYVYVTLPKPNLDTIIVDYKTVHRGIRSHFNRTQFDAAIKAFEAFRTANQPKVNYIFQQFEMKKQADRYKRTKIHKTGAIDTLRLASYKYEDNLFKTISIVADGKNHGLIFVVDWSISMQHSMAGTLEQLIVLCLFCRKANIPFEVYSLTTGSTLKSFNQLPTTLSFASNFQMRTYLSSQMTPQEFTDACVNLFALMPNREYNGGPRNDNLIGCTPLNEAIVTTIDLMEVFRRRTSAQIVNAVFLTDGGANTVNQYYDSRGRIQSMFSYYGDRNSNNRFLIDDRLSHKVYDFDFRMMTPTLLEILRDRQNINVVGFFIGGSWEMFFHKPDAARKAVIKKQFDEDGYVVSTEWGYNELYITKGGNDLQVREVKMKPKNVEAGDDKFVDAAASNLTKQGTALLKQRLMLDRFVKMIA